ncbi:MAG: hypothetical protein ACLFN1_00980 [Bacteroidales bacterium]
MERISKQMEEDEMIKRSDYLVNNSDDSMIVKEVLDIHRDILSDLKKA